MKTVSTESLLEGLHRLEGHFMEPRVETPVVFRLDGGIHQNILVPCPNVPHHVG